MIISKYASRRKHRSCTECLINGHQLIVSVVMELSQSLVSLITKASFLFISSQHPYESNKNAKSPSLSWSSSSLNPKNPINSLDNTNSCWRIDGATMCGRQVYAVPTCLLPNLVPLRIDLFIPDQEQYSQDLRANLQSSFSGCMRHPRLEHLGISRHLCRALDHYCGQNSDFLRDYQKLPFGSKLIFENISADFKAMSLTAVPAHDLERQLLSVTSLKRVLMVPSFFITSSSFFSQILLTRTSWIDLSM